MNTLYQPIYKLSCANYFAQILLVVGFLFLPIFMSGQSTVVVTATDAIATEGTPADDTGVFLIDLGSVNTTGGNVVVNFVFSGTATSGTDYVDLGSNISIPDGDRTAQLIVVPVDDTSFEGNESVQIRLTGTDDGGFTVAGNSSSNAIITLVDNDGCSAGGIAPPLVSSIPERYCSGVEVDLSSFVTRAAPSGTTLRWSTDATPDPNDEASFLDSSVIMDGGDFYGFYYGSENGNACISPVVSLPSISFDTSPSLGALSNNNQVCNQGFFGIGTSLDLDDALNGQTLGGIWNLIDSPAGQTTSINSGNSVSYNGQPIGSYIYTYTPNYAGAPSCPPESIEVSIFVTECTPCGAGNTPPQLNTEVNTDFCVVAGQSISQDLAAYTSSSAPSGTNLIWSRSNDYTRSDVFLTNTLVSQEGTYYAFFLDEADDCASPVLSVSIIINQEPEITATENALCSEGIMTLEATATDGSTINWYATETSTTPLEENSPSFTTPNLTQTTTYYAQAVIGSCLSDRIPVVATISNEPVVQAVTTPLNACNVLDSDFATVIDLNTGLTQSVSGTWEVTSDPSNALSVSGTDTVDFINAPVGTYTFTFTTDTAVAPCSDVLVTITVTVVECVLDTDMDGLTNAEENTLGTNPDNEDSDDDGILDGVEVGDDVENPLDEDNDGIIDALDSNILDSDLDGVVDQLDPANFNPCVPNAFAGACDSECGVLFNQFSPNSDGINDFLTISCLENYPNNSIEIFDRYGNQVYKAVRYQNNWNGTGKNGDLPKGTYYYVLNLGDGSPITKGWIQIIR
ncbi:gliding motility-associated C-terminal domain-containing protein [Cellulophaga sp. E16_2]|uniref:T9SS type B sorting domain-containing protein n=1 Tax=Cellulophaga sp. E16_2 TaxID=2789297 RepID=UPI001A9398D4|nr:gliding motility-associated C-terminal domain-containing protein [Cellulophaga sp. E16_2]MBO0591855.1 gliding motility-associated C-terminal domain-containing protein [Cellulophaga sp. E16_2]